MTINYTRPHTVTWLVCEREILFKKDFNKNGIALFNQVLVNGTAEVEVCIG